MKWKFTKRIIAVSGTVLLFAVAPCFQSGQAFAGAVNRPAAIFQEMQVSGTVTSAEDNTPLPGVSIAVKGGTTGTVTDGEGRYQLTAPGNATLVFSYIGFTAQEVPVNNQSQLNVKMAVDQKQLE